LLLDKALELTAEAWMIRAFAKRKPNIFLLLLGIGDESPLLQRGRSEFGMQLVLTINRLEAGGWLVTPWDFAEREPKFLALLKSLNR
jgi:hypothetical protein